jgi:hypothetical protein
MSQELKNIHTLGHIFWDVTILIEKSLFIRLLYDKRIKYNPKMAGNIPQIPSDCLLVK